ncbi:MAG: hypothetical protein ACE5H1_08765 [Thermodesulfobacteriota bacterium]
MFEIELTQTQIDEMFQNNRLDVKLSQDEVDNILADLNCHVCGAPKNKLKVVLKSTCSLVCERKNIRMAYHG